VPTCACARTGRIAYCRGTKAEDGDVGGAGKNVCAEVMAPSSGLVRGIFKELGNILGGDV
jgi:hypothetical protein